MDRRTFLVAAAGALPGCGGLTSGANTGTATETAAPVPDTETESTEGVVVEVETQTATPTPTVEVAGISTAINYEFGLGGGYSMSVRVEGTFEDTGVTVLLSSPAGETVADGSISDERLLDGVDVVELSLPSPLTPGAYTLQIVRGGSFSSDAKLIHEETVRIGQQDANIDDFKLETTEAEYSGEYLIDRLAVTVANTGGVPLPIQSVTVQHADGEERYIDTQVLEVVSTLEETTVATTSTATLPRIQAGDQQLTLRAYTPEAKVAERRVKVVR